MVIFNFQFSILNFIYVFWSQFYHHAAIAPLRASGAGAHAIDHYLLWAAGCWHHETTWAHAEAIDAPALYLRDEAVLRSWEVLSTAFFGVVLYLVDAVRRMLQAHAHSDALGLYLHPVMCQPTIDIAGRMACSQYDWPLEHLARMGFDAHHLIIMYDECIHARLEVHFTSTTQDSVSHILYDAWQLVCAYVRMGIYQDGGRCAMLTEHVEDLLYIASLLATGVELTI